MLNLSKEATEILGSNLVDSMKAIDLVQSNKERIMKKSNNKTVCNRLINGYDYDNQAWVKNGLYVRCGHPENVNCNCYGKRHEGEQTN